MGPIAYVNGRYVPHAAAMVHIDDRACQFADGVYEVFALRNGRLADSAWHFARLARSLAELRIGWPMQPAAMVQVFKELVRRNRSPTFGSLYMQISRGVAPRNHAFPPGAKPTLIATVRALPLPTYAAACRPVAVITRPDIRWQRVDIKSVSLLPNVLAKQLAAEAGCYEAWLIDAAGCVTEGTASNACIVNAAGEVVTHPADHAILHGITRAVTLDLARALRLPVIERPFTLAEAYAASEAFLTSTTSFVKPVGRIDDRPVGSGAIGPVTDRLLRAYLAHIEAEGVGLR